MPALELADLELAFRPATAERVTLTVHGVPIIYDARKEQVSAKGTTVPLPPNDGVVRLRILVDRGSLEVFGTGGRVAWCIPSVGGGPGVAVSSQGGSVQVDSLELWTLRSSWK